MADNYLITGYWGTPHVTAENDRGINAGTLGTGRFVLPVGKQFNAEYIGNNTVRIHDGKLIDNGAAAGIPAGEYVDLLIANASQGMARNDLIVFEYSKNSETQVESGSIKVVQGTEASGSAKDPELSQSDLLSGNASIDQMPLWRISVNAATISDLTKVFETRTLMNTSEIPPVVQTQLNGKLDQHTWQAIIAGSTWSRLCYVVNDNVKGCTFLLNIAGTRGSVVYNDTYIIKAHHHYKAHIVKISGNTYTTGLGIRVVVGGNGQCYVELYDDAGGITSATAMAVTCCLIPIYGGGVTLYSEFTDGTTLPDGYQAGAALTTNENPIQCSNINVLSTDYYGTALPAAGRAGRIFFKKVSS